MTTPQQAGDLIRRVIEMGYYNPDPNRTHGHPHMCHALTDAQEELTAEERKHVEGTKNMIFFVMNSRDHLVHYRTIYMGSFVYWHLKRVFGFTSGFWRNSPTYAVGAVAMYKDWERVVENPDRILSYFHPYVYAG